jgi:hypothetical protein
MALYLFYISVPSSASEMVLAIEAELQKNHSQAELGNEINTYNT